METIIAAASHTLLKAKLLLGELSNEQLCDAAVSPYYSSAGSHIRHIIDFYDCILQGIPSGNIDLASRKRDERMANNCEFAINSIDNLIQELEGLSVKLDMVITVQDDLGQGVIKMPQTVAGLLAQANSHTIHHYAIISYILDGLNIRLQDSFFGYNPTTPIRVNN
jgi:hypothetical protein